MDAGPKNDPQPELNFYVEDNYDGYGVDPALRAGAGWIKAVAGDYAKWRENCAEGIHSSAARRDALKIERTWRPLLAPKIIIIFWPFLIIFLPVRFS